MAKILHDPGQRKFKSDSWVSIRNLPFYNPWEIALDSPIWHCDKWHSPNLNDLTQKLDRMTSLVCFLSVQNLAQKRHATYCQPQNSLQCRSESIASQNASPIPRTTHKMNRKSRLIGCTKKIFNSMGFSSYLWNAFLNYCFLISRKCFPNHSMDCSIYGTPLCLIMGLNSLFLSEVVAMLGSLFQS